jgi:hypothetical protein
MDYSKAVGLCQKLINASGRLITIERLSGTAQDSTKPWKGAGTPTVEKSIKQKGTFLIHEGRRDLGFLGLDEELLKRVEQIVLVAPGTVDLTDYNAILDNTVRYSIEWLRILKPGSVTCLYVFGVKR